MTGSPSAVDLRYREKNNKATLFIYYIIHVIEAFPVQAQRLLYILYCFYHICCQLLPAASPEFSFVSGNFNKNDFLFNSLR